MHFYLHLFDVLLLKSHNHHLHNKPFKQHFQKLAAFKDNKTIQNTRCSFASKEEFYYPFYHQ